jgi:hypothetical protein
MRRWPRASRWLVAASPPLKLVAPMLTHEPGQAPVRTGSTTTVGKPSSIRVATDGAAASTVMKMAPTRPDRRRACGSKVTVLSRTVGPMATSRCSERAASMTPFSTETTYAFSRPGDSTSTVPSGRERRRPFPVGR